MSNPLCPKTERERDEARELVLAAVRLLTALRNDGWDDRMVNDYIARARKAVR